MGDSMSAFKIIKSQMDVEKQSLTKGLARREMQEDALCRSRSKQVEAFAIRGDRNGAKNRGRTPCEVFQTIANFFCVAPNESITCFRLGWLLRGRPLLPLYVNRRIYVRSSARKCSLMFPFDGAAAVKTPDVT
jgi:hypothetical protein